MRNVFDPEKAVETFLYLAPQIGGDMYKTLKLLYLADKLHLENSGSLILGDWYAALSYGPVASNCYDLLKFVRSGQGNDAGAPEARNAFSVEGDQIVPKREADLDYLSKSDINCLDEAIRKYGHMTFGELKRLTHDEAYEAAPRNGKIDIYAIAATLPNGAEVSQHLSDPYPEYRS